MKNNKTTKDLQNKTMNTEVYKMRRSVMNFIYEAKKLAPELPRIDVRITDNHKDIAGMGRIGHKIIWITEKFTINRGVVFHEILHAIGQDHIKNCPLMSGKGTSIALPKNKCEILFKKYANQLLK